jgi:hypothetical protein
MSEGYTNLNRAFMVKEPGDQLTPLNDNVSRWNRADVVRLRLHPAFRIPQDGPVGIKAGPYFSPLTSNLQQYNSVYRKYINSADAASVMKSQFRPSVLTIHKEELKA